MARYMALAVVQAPPRDHRAGLQDFADEVGRIASTLPLSGLVTGFSTNRMIIYPEEHLCGIDGPTPAARVEQWESIAEPLQGPRLDRLGTIARDAGVWLRPGSVIERGPNGELWNTAPLLSPEGELVAVYRKIFPFRPNEPFTPGREFVVADLPGVGRLGLSICYDIWFPEVSRQLAWMGAEIIVTVAQTDGSDRPVECVMTRSAAIANQVFVVSANSAAPLGTGKSMIVDPEGIVRYEAYGDTATVLTDVIDLDQVEKVRQTGTSGLGRPWSLFADKIWRGNETDSPLELPVYQGRIDPATWEPRREGRPQWRSAASTQSGLSTAVHDVDGR